MQTDEGRHSAGLLRLRIGRVNMEKIDFEASAVIAEAKKNESILLYVAHSMIEKPEQWFGAQAHTAARQVIELVRDLDDVWDEIENGEEE